MTVRIAVLMVFFFIFSAFCVQADDASSTAGEQYIKLDDSGRKLTQDAEQWTMVLDTATGLIWEVKTVDGSIHDKQAGYNWEDAHDVFLAELNTSRFGGFSDWRLPTTDELRTIRVKGAEPYINQDFFPNTVPTSYMSWRKCGSGEIFSERVKFGKLSNKKISRQVRAVRNSGFAAPIEEK